MGSKDILSAYYMSGVIVEPLYPFTHLMLPKPYDGGNSYWFHSI